MIEPTFTLATRPLRTLFLVGVIGHHVSVQRVCEISMGTGWAI